MTRRMIRADESPTVAVVQAVAAHLEADPRSLEPPLGTVIDPDHLDGLAATEAVDVCFTYCDCEVRIVDTVVVEVESG